MKLDYLIEITTSQNITYRYFTFDLNIEKFIGYVMNNEQCPRRAIITINIEQVV